MNVSTFYSYRSSEADSPWRNPDESLAGILFPYDATSTTDGPVQSSTGTTKDIRKDTTPKPPLVKASDLVPSETKVELVLGAEEDIKDAERILREIQVLVERGADGSGDLACK